jgi:ribosomal protein S3
MLQARNYQPFSSMSNPSVYPNDKVHTHRIKFIFTIKPVESLVISPQIVADYIADKIEQSIPIQSLYQDIQQYFSTYESSTTGEGTQGTRNAILGYRLLCSGRLQKTKFSKPAEMAESLSFQNGVLPLNSIGKDIQYGASSTTNAYGSCGIKV